MVHLGKCMMHRWKRHKPGMKDHTHQSRYRLANRSPSLARVHRYPGESILYLDAPPSARLVRSYKTPTAPKNSPLAFSLPTSKQGLCSAHVGRDVGDKGAASSSRTPPRRHLGDLTSSGAAVGCSRFKIVVFQGRFCTTLEKCCDTGTVPFFGQEYFCPGGQAPFTEELVNINHCIVLVSQWLSLLVAFLGFGIFHRSGFTFV